jgi:hypothetical protein
MKAVDPTVEESRNRTEPLHLSAARLVTQRPRAEVLAIIPQDVVAVLAQPRSRTLYHFVAIEASFVMAQPDAMAMGEMFERHFLHWSAPQPVRKARIVNDAPVAHVDAMVTVERTPCNEMRAEWRLLSEAQITVAKEDLFLVGLDRAYIVCPLEHGAAAYAAVQSLAIGQWCRAIPSDGVSCVLPEPASAAASYGSICTPSS